MATTTWGWLVLLFPLLGTLIIGFGYRVLPGRSAGVIGTAAIGLAFVAALGALISLESHSTSNQELTSTLWNYANTVGVNAKVSILVDPLSVFMILIVSGISSMIHLYSISYLEEDRGFARYFAYLNFFVFAMLLLVLAGNFLLLIVGWALVGAASYLLISFWYRRTTATEAGIKAFVINVLGDAGLVLGTYFIFKHTHTLDFLGTFAAAPHVFHSGEADIVAGCLLLLVGAIAKSAQIPLHTWLPDAMEGPTPVSALIHAATMVTAGVYLIARMHVLFELAPAAQDTGAAIGAITLLIAGTIALVQTDIKRVIAYSTMSQIGYMIMGESIGAYAAGMFHLMTHAFFKALLFMGAGSIIGAMAGEQSLQKMGGFRRALPFTFACFVIGGLALSGIPPFSGFFSKDEILLVTAERGGWHWILYVMGYIGAFITAIYTFRMIFRAFYGDPVKEARELEAGHLHHASQPTNPANGEVEDTDVGFPGPHHTIAERALPMKVAMSVLAIGAVGAGLVQIPEVDDVITSFLRPTFAGSPLYEPHTRDGLLIFGLCLGTALGLTGIAIAYRIWVKNPAFAVRARERFGAVYELLWHKWYFDELIDALVVRPAAAFGRFATGTFERVFVQDTLIGGSTGIVRAGSAAVRAVQSGFLRYYAALLVLGVTGVSLYFLLQT
ncbi:MAG TPA: NADH-quinone oxidoreductase subunit L [Solirubrobacteraceae bacterium]|jgi:NADH-quinone oxidoreductase subunit L|nr:NADH-quinone oxidoreductase subunit L [Solirubrobacteraceae bacterium]